jgi:hypothetical protein
MIRKIAGALVAACVSCASLASSTLTTDYSDLWWNPNESGWGANIALQNDTMVVTLFIYNGQREPSWFIAPNTVYNAHNNTFSGPLYITTGPWFANVFDPTSVTVQQVGMLTFAPSAFNKAVLSYNQGGQPITKNIIRQSWKADGLAGIYQGSRQGTWSNCGAPLDGKVSSITTLGVSQDPNNVVIFDQGKGYTCTYTGPLTSSGRQGSIIGTGVCDDHVNREFSATEVYVSREVFTMRYHMQQVGSECAFDGFVGGIRQVP